MSAELAPGVAAIAAKFPDVNVDALNAVVKALPQYTSVSLRPDDKITFFNKGGPAEKLMLDLKDGTSVDLPSADGSQGYVLKFSKPEGQDAGEIIGEITLAESDHSAASSNTLNVTGPEASALRRRLKSGGGKGTTADKLNPKKDDRWPDDLPGQDFLPPRFSGFYGDSPDKKKT